MSDRQEVTTVRQEINGRICISHSSRLMIKNRTVDIWIIAQRHIHPEYFTQKLNIYQQSFGNSCIALIRV